MEKITNKTGLRILQVFLAIVLFLSTIGMLYEFLLGDILFAFGVAINPVSAIDLALNIRNVTTTTFIRPVATLLISVAYYGLAVWMIRNMISSITAFINCLKGKEYYTTIRVLWADYNTNFFIVILFFSLSNMMEGYAHNGINDSLLLVLIVGMLIHVASKICLHIAEQGDVTGALYEGLLCSGIVIIGWTLFAYTLRDASAYEVCQGFSIMGSWTSVKELSGHYIVTFIYEVFIENILLIVLQIQTLKCLNDALSFVNYRNVERHRIMTILITSCVLAGTNIVASAYLAGGNLADSIAPTLMTYCPMILSIAVVYIAWKFPDILAIRASSGESNPPPTPDATSAEVDPAASVAETAPDPAPATADPATSVAEITQDV